MLLTMMMSFSVGRLWQLASVEIIFLLSTKLDLLRLTEFLLEVHRKIVQAHLLTSMILSSTGASLALLILLLSLIVDRLPRV